MGSGPIVAPATPLLPSAVAILRISGPDLASTLAPLLTLTPPRQAALKTLRFSISNSAQRNCYEEHCLVLYFPAPRSYTGEDVVELQVHGNPLLVRRLLEYLGSLGITLAEPGEFTRRALLNGKQGLMEVEALRDLVVAQTDQQLRQAQARSGGVPPWLKEAKARIAPWVARAEAAVDYGEEEGLHLDLPALTRDLEGLQEVFHVERRRARAAGWLRSGIRLALVGRPNAGKSTLYNALAGADRAIVTEIPGTTRDVLETTCEWRGLPLRLFDTAGWRDTEDPVERLGVARIAQVLGEVDLILHLVPAQDPQADPAIEKALKPYAGRVLVVRTQTDLAPGIPGISVPAGDLWFLESALKARFLEGQQPEALLGALASARQVELLEALADQVEALLALPPAVPPEVPASLLQGAWSLLQSLTGEDRADTALDHLFGSFCLGK